MGCSHRCGTRLIRARLSITPHRSNVSVSLSCSVIDNRQPLFKPPFTSCDLIVDALLRPRTDAFSGGSPTDHALHSNAGVATNGSISMQIPAHQGRWQLTLYCGVLNATARLTVTASGQPSVTRLVDTLTQHVDTSGDDSQVTLQTSAKHPPNTMQSLNH
jgi:hypothetical protein